MSRLAILLALAVLGTARADDAPPSFGGRYPHLAVTNSAGECGIGAVVPWAGRLWLVTYAPHARRGSDDRLYVIDERGGVRAVSPADMEGRLSAAAPLWAVGWDEKSVLLLVRSAADAAAGRDPWHVFRLPKSCTSYDGDHGWHTEWPRIREVVPAAAGRPARYLLTMHGGWYEFPGTFSATATGGICPLCTHLKITGDVAPWTIDGEERIVFGCDDAAKSGFKSEQQNLAGGGRRRAGCTRPGRPRRTTPPRQGVAHRARRLVRRGERDPEGGHENLPAAEAARSRGGGGACKTVRVGLAAGPAGGGHGAEPAPGGRHVLRAAAGVERWCRKDPARVQPLETDHRFLLVAQAARARRRQAGGHGRADHGSGRHIAGAGRQRHGRRDVPRRGRVGGRRGRTLETAARRPRSRTAESRP